MVDKDSEGVLLLVIQSTVRRGIDDTNQALREAKVETSILQVVQKHSYAKKTPQKKNSAACQVLRPSTVFLFKMAATGVARQQPPYNRTCP